MTRAIAEDWCLRVPPRDWQRNALDRWRKNYRGVVSVVTGSGKTIFAFLCMQDFLALYPDGKIIILVPTITLLDQWYVGLQEDLGVPAEDVGSFSGQEKTAGERRVNIIVINTGRELVQNLAIGGHWLLIVDECHRVGSPENARAIQGKFMATLGLSATPEREYDEGFKQYVAPVLGPIIFRYDYVAAFGDRVITPFDLINVEIDLLETEKIEYERLTRRAAILFQKAKTDSSFDDQLKEILRRRAGVAGGARMRIPVAAKIAEENRGIRTIIFHERVKAATVLYSILRQRSHSVSIYHSHIPPLLRRDNLRLFRRGVFDILVSCRALDEGMNVPETSIAIIASSTASQRQRIQRLGRVLRPAHQKSKATIYTLYATEQERNRLKSEAARLEGVATVLWAKGQRKEE